MYHVAYLRSRASPIRHLANPWGRSWHPGMTGKSLCGSKVNMAEATIDAASAGTQPAGTCKRCAAAIGLKVSAA